MNYYLNVLKSYAIFSGRARRSEYWYFVLFNIIFAFVAIMLDKALGTSFTIQTAAGPINLFYGYVYIIYNLFILLPAIAVLVRRLHDVGKSGWFVLITLIPIVGSIWILVLLCTDSVPGKNQYGLNPKGIGNYDEIDQVGDYLTK
ncbi:MAG TPA: DUF805 domain-containing protein [Hanamia sp.]|jgi:uncharacterized membrane protein YhaH (DUF805 family)|nr:DUF805 domain-containing protein [Hanamia sp.]